ncbi:DUF4145 domain-containing protein [Geomicrobium sediminis]|uniref:DNA-binding protein n=1 Tax=Geomicrobium sediminis TaxID=1347788 RepID=A0ABS2PHN2_9BACL|nr:DUF4145 domain-containing protein [Geomicrobium sediminis]MBM7634950.1 putative DNA-binding protein [Geomicrobium sediminis]
MVENIVPSYGQDSFNCLRCGRLTPQKWYMVRKINKFGITTIEAFEGKRGYTNSEEYTWYLDLSLCTYCNDYTIWESQKIIYPLTQEAPAPHVDMPEDVRKIYEEASMVYKHSPRATAALLRLAIETMIPELEDYKVKNGNLNSMIASLVEQNIPEHIQKGLDLIRVNGNNGVHAGEINLNEEVETVSFLFYLINHMTEDLITRNKRIDSLYNKLPARALASIERRDNK